MEKHECDIGMLWEDYEITNIVTLSYLKEFIRKEQARQKWMDDHYPADYWGRKKVATLKDYGDLRKSTALERFKFCPECGKRINWKAIREADDA